jgi:hypothetical protein
MLPLQFHLLVEGSSEFTERFESLLLAVEAASSSESLNKDVAKRIIRQQGLVVPESSLDELSEHLLKMSLENATSVRQEAVKQIARKLSKNVGVNSC